MKRFAFAILTLFLFGLLFMLTAQSTLTANADEKAASVAVPQVATSFEAIQIYIDSNETPLAAYQLSFKATRGNVQITGIQGADAGTVFHEPPYYDAKAIQQNQVKLADFSTAKSEKLPKGKTRIATIMLVMPQLSSSPSPQPRMRRVRLFQRNFLTNEEIK